MITKEKLQKLYEKKNAIEVAKELGINRRYVYRLLKRFNIERKGRQKALSGRKLSEIHKKRIGIKSIERKDTIRTQMIYKLKNNIIKNKDTKPERLIESWLINNNINYVKQYVYKLGIADFYLPEKNTIIEADGEYWHRLTKEKDNFKTQYLENEGYRVLRFTDKQLYNNFNECVVRI